jgi:hypothetical protein
MGLEGRVILIVESRVSQFIVSLQDALEAAGAESRVVSTMAKAHERIVRFTFSVAAISAENGPLTVLDLPAVVYGTAKTPRLAGRSWRLYRDCSQSKTRVRS